MVHVYAIQLHIVSIHAPLRGATVRISSAVCIGTKTALCANLVLF